MPTNSPKISNLYRMVIVFLFLSVPLTAYVMFLLRPPHILVGLVAVLLTCIFHGHFVGQIMEPYYFRDSDTYESPTEDQRLELERLCEVADLHVQGVWVSAKLKRFMPAVILGAFPYNRHLIADETFFTAHTAREREAIIVYETYLAKRYYYTFTAMLVTLPLLCYLVLIGQLRNYWLDPLGLWRFTLGAILSIALATWIARRLVYRALDRAVAQTDTKTAEAIVEKAGEREGKKRQGLEVNAMDLLVYPRPNQRLKYLQ